jgi:hypothetical protein
MNALLNLNQTRWPSGLPERPATETHANAMPSSSRFTSVSVPAIAPACAAVEGRALFRSSRGCRLRGHDLPGPTGENVGTILTEHRPLSSPRGLGYAVRHDTKRSSTLGTDWRGGSARCAGAGDCGDLSGVPDLRAGRSAPNPYTAGVREALEGAVTRRRRSRLSLQARKQRRSGEGGRN